MFVVQLMTRRPGESKSQEAAVSEGQDLHLRQEGQESLVAQVAVAPRSPLLQRVVVVGVLQVEELAQLDLLKDCPRPSAPDAQEAQQEGHDDASPLSQCPPRGHEGRRGSIHASEGH